MSDDPSEFAKTAHPRRTFFAVIAVMGVLSLFFVILLRGVTVQPGMSGPAPGTPAPAIAAQGWLNGPAPTAEDLAGKVVLVDAWATWCGPCWAKAPELVALHRKYSPEGVIFIGLTSDPASEVPKMKLYFQRTGVSWVNGYGADQTLADLKAYTIPRVWVIGRDGNLVWSDYSGTPLEDGIKKALAQR